MGLTHPPGGLLDCGPVPNGSRWSENSFPTNASTKLPSARLSDRRAAQSYVPSSSLFGDAAAYNRARRCRDFPVLPSLVRNSGHRSGGCPQGLRLTGLPPPGADPERSGVRETSETCRLRSTGQLSPTSGRRLFIRGGGSRSGAIGGHPSSRKRNATSYGPGRRAASYRR